MSKIRYLFTLLVVSVSCKDINVALDDGQETEWEIAASQLPTKIALNGKSKSIVADWAAFNTFDASFDRMYDATYREDLVLIIEDLVENQKALESSTYPVEFDIPQVKGRQKVLKTFILKTKGDLEYRQDPKVSITEMIAAYNSFRNQLNVEVNNTLPEDLILNKAN
ncbi:hypothetical protein ACFQZJ_01715 [Maribacter chungangensis]|uniref:Uncharacterized protein n=1 Tax=Maribacter chungangensis TaxID=1069117 RepID=A0ABW3AZY3_9FLAO